MKKNDIYILVSPVTFCLPTCCIFIWTTFVFYMKLALYILALYTIVLSCIPCQDEIQLPVSEVSSSYISRNADQNQQNPMDLCSPFCICACCSGITLQYITAILPDITIFSFPEEKSFTYMFHPGSGNSMIIWQPPRI